MKSSKPRKRKVDILVLSDIHLGTYGCRAKELLNYLRSVSPKQVILNGDIIDIWQFSKRYWPKSHMKVVSHLFKWMSKGVKMHYITGNHDEMLRKFEGFKVGSFRLQNKLVLELEGEKVWVFHGDVFDVTMQHSRWLTKLGAIGYDTLILINQVVNTISEFFGKGRISLSKKVKNSVKGAVKFINKFEETATTIAAENGYKYVMCGHIHHPEIKEYETEHGRVTYLNSGDWIENLSALEYKKGEWSIYKYTDEEFEKIETQSEEIYEADYHSDFSPKELYGKMLQEMLIVAPKN
ncbi:UDP-2,3-diacylglucosamine pyrophosphatase LpxH [Reichenbachiella faecimaris]|uniref:UDP-2,3-diacylglucosamine pyrophosphatase LpxH n=1 Tax=Reichenbachiella faecimaris TaxID=692418 RepID=A0A1W2G7H0_REIFA|nr:UDP-2,3-diacylglucosamine diphosphatase [Reichenbachiella faecimaris]SMD32630.1 UDP-2,3-diacylglucosamine pyrophosphatase LpxH [Reichenbachiella faecimaris]